MISLLFLLLAADPPAPSASTVPGDKMICRRLDRTGSRLGSRPVCATAFQWKLLSDRARRDLDDVQRRAQPEKLPPF